MAGDPRRWLSDGGHGGELERELLASVRDARPPADAKERAWRGLATAIAAGAAVTSIAPSAAAASSLLTKVVWTVAASSIAAGGYFAAQQLMSRPERAPEPKSAHAAPASAPAVAAPDVERDEHAAPSVPLEAPRVEPRQPKRLAPKAQDALTRESAGLMRARAALRAGDATEAERLLHKLASELPGGVLLQEREVLAIEVLAAKGDTDAARARTRAFARAHPASPHTDRLRALLEAR